jgi:ubiquinone/menaquinone biosynthesis C-methylase UbiE
MVKMSQEHIWNKIASDWTKFRSKPINEVIEFLKDKKGKLLDFGCGSGRNMVKQDGLEYYGSDFSETMLKFAKEKAEKQGMKSKLSKFNVEKLGFEDEFFDTAIFISTLHCIENETLRKKALQELFRVLKSGAEAMISVWDKSKDEDMKHLETNGGFIDWNKNGETFKRYYYFYEEDELIYLLKDVGFEITKIGEYGDGKHEKKNIVIYVKK